MENSMEVPVLQPNRIPEIVLARALALFALLGCLTCSLLLLKVVPIFGGLFNGLRADLPFATRLLVTHYGGIAALFVGGGVVFPIVDRKSTRLNSSHTVISYAVFCLKKKKNIYNNYFKAPCMHDRTEANPNELNQDDARYGFRCCHLKNIWTAPLPPETELSRQMTTSTSSIDIIGLQAVYFFF